MTSLFATLSLLIMSQFLVDGTEGAKKQTCEQYCDVTSLNPQGNYTLPRRYVAYPCINLAYRVHLDAYRNWTEAETICESEGGHLAVIDSELKLKHALRPPIPRFLGIRHVGIYLGDDDWVSVVDGTTVRHIPWALNNPIYSYDKICAAISHAVSYRRIMAVRCGDFGDFVCQISLPEVCPEKKKEKDKPCVECNAYNFDTDCR